MRRVDALQAKHKKVAWHTPRSSPTTGRGAPPYDSPSDDPHGEPRSAMATITLQLAGSEQPQWATASPLLKANSEGSVPDTDTTMRAMSFTSTSNDDSRDGWMRLASQPNLAPPVAALETLLHLISEIYAAKVGAAAAAMELRLSTVLMYYPTVQS
jgi:hypothetical protein